jgi:hypothetical protein
VLSVWLKNSDLNFLPEFRISSNNLLNDFYVKTASNWRSFNTVFGKIQACVLSADSTVDRNFGIAAQIRGVFFWFFELLGHLDVPHTKKNLNSESKGNIPWEFFLKILLFEPLTTVFMTWKWFDRIYWPWKRIVSFIPWINFFN